MAPEQVMRHAIDGDQPAHRRRTNEHTLTDGDRCRPPASADILFDPQTSGGLLAGVPSDRLDAVLRDLRAAGYAEAAAVGEVTDRKGVLELR